MEEGVRIRVERGSGVGYGFEGKGGEGQGRLGEGVDGGSELSKRYRLGSNLDNSKLSPIRKSPRVR